MREEDARKKWCPMVNMINFEGSIVDNRGDYFEGRPALCIASDCMMWVWDMDITFSELGPRNNGRSKTEGHCGLIK